jgi:type IV pilus assembly protein PilB
VTSYVPIGQYLVEAGRIDAAQLSSALAQQKLQGGRLGECLVSLGHISESLLFTELARKHGVAYVLLGDYRVNEAVVRLVPERLIRARKIFPFAQRREQGRMTLLVATSAPQDLTALDEIAFVTGMRVKGALASDRDIEHAIERHLGPRLQTWGAHHACAPAGTPPPPWASPARRHR